MRRLLMRGLAARWRPRGAGDLEALQARYGRLPPDFDPERYIELYPDLASLRNTPLGPHEHFLKHGRSEGRNYASRVAPFEVEHGQLPADFDEGTYIDLHPDLEFMRGEAGKAAEHYLRAGRSEGRPYKRLSKLALSRRQKVRPAAQQPEEGPDQHEASDLPDAPDLEEEPDLSVWSNRFNVAEFRIMHPDLAGEIRTRQEGEDVFLRQGIDRLLPLSFEHRFEPGFYRARYTDAAALTPAEAYRHWLFEGLSQGRPGSRSELIRSLTGQPDYPDAFDWQAYGAAHASSFDSSDQLAALEHLVEHGVSDAAAVPVRGEEAAQFLERLAEKQWKHPRRKLALALLERALQLGPAAGGRHWLYAAWQETMGDLAKAEQHYAAAWQHGYRSVYLVRNLARLCSERGDFDAAYGWLREGRGAFAGYVVWLDALLDTVRQDFDRAAQAALASYRIGQRGAGDETLRAALVRITAALETLDHLPAALPPVPAGHVVMFANHGLAQCRHYRVEQRCRQFKALGIPVEVFDSDHPNEARQALIGARALIVYREPAYPDTIRTILHARAMGIPVFYEIDDLIFDSRHYPESFEAYGQQIPLEDYVGLLYGVPLFRFAATLCDAGIASTEALARHLGPLTRRGRCHVVANGLDDRNERFIAARPPLRRASDDLFVFYGSGSKAHNRNFNDTVGPALIEVMRARPRVKLVVVGHLDLDAGFESLAGRTIRYDFTRDLEAYWALLSEVDINLAVLVPGELSDCKSEIKWLEAAVVGVPSAVSASATYRASLHDGVDAVLVEDAAGWRDALFRLVDDEALRQQIGARARELALRTYSLPMTAAQVAAALGRVAPPGSAADAPQPRRTRVLIAHVLFPPQTFGGATRVVRDNVDDLLRDHAEEIEVAVYTSDFHAGPGSSRVDAYGPIPVFRYGCRTETALPYRDAKVARHFGQVLDAWKPGLVHFHCIQHLTGSIAELCHHRGLPYVVTVHDAWWISPHQFLVDQDNFLHPPTSRGIAEALSPDATLSSIDRKRYLLDRLHEAGAVTAVSESFARIYRDCGIAQVEAIPNGLSAAFLAGRNRPRETKLKRARVRLGHIGGLPLHKGLHLLRAALERGDYEHLEAVVIDHAQEPSYERQDHWGTTPVLLRGTVAQDRVIDLYRSFDVLIAPSIWPESFGLVSREALALGLWVVVSDLGALHEGVVEGQSGFVIDVGGPGPLMEVLRQIDADPDRFLQSPAVAFEPRQASEQTRDFVELYRRILAVASPSGGTAAGS